MPRKQLVSATLAKAPRRRSFAIGELAQLIGISVHTIRMWERRHAFLEPQRLENGHRRYSEEDLTVVHTIRALLDQGTRIGDIARLGRQEILQRASEAALLPPEDDYLDGRHPEVAWAVLEALPSAVIVTDKRGLVRWLNRGVVALCGYDLAELHGLKPGSVLQGPDSDAEAAEQLRAATLAQRPCSVAILNYHKSGEPYLALVEVTPLRVGLKHVGFVGTARRIAGPSALLLASTT